MTPHASARHRRLRLISAASLGTLVAAWWLATAGLGLVSPIVLPSPLEVLQRLGWLLTHRFQGETLAGHVLASLRIVVIAWLLALGIGIPLGLVMGWWRPVERFVNPLFQLLRPIPPIAWIPLSIMWFGIHDGARIFVIVMAAFSPCVLNAFEGVRAVDPVQVRAARTLGAPDRVVLAEVVVPAALPLLVAGARLALGNAWMTMVAAELLAARAGLGYIMQIARRMLQPDIILVSMIAIGVLGALLSALLRVVARRLTPWQVIDVA
jgi:ABC-type nitrate/sulfonate/bicarbonate transport system permease component